ncbi:putative aldouronate transport system permease protein [Fontibacillus panacisegetis]|uniref:Putative aldouronate transport system permease protein n=1 Tax=Fontibacillus panacisegetis TaxID=670482 RepID=A0A1G7FW13_9BACL|nr:ABC transporter permease subunit [Fontibacillus panacisegetis]SDE80061.1 putative aldouronate transport system permease protein [Fontibacillus panacisegetis]
MDAASELKANPKARSVKPTRSLWKKVKQQKALMAMSIPFVLFVIVFSYVPLWGWLMAFQDFKLGTPMLQNHWVGLDNFRELFRDDSFLRVIRNTLAMSIINLVFGFLSSITLALLLNELRSIMFKRIVQTISYLPHFISWVVAANLIMNMLSIEGIVNYILVNLHLIQEPILWLSKGEYFWWIIGASNVWKGVGWGAIIYLAAMTMIDPSLYEAASIDGAGRFRKIFHITLPGIRPIIVILLIMSIGHILDAGFEQQYLLQTPMVVDQAETIDLFVLKYGINLSRYSFATASGIFKTLISVILLVAANQFAKRMGQERLF